MLFATGCGGGEEPQAPGSALETASSDSASESHSAREEFDPESEAQADLADEAEGYGDFDVAVVDAVQDGISVELQDEDPPFETSREQAQARIPTTSSALRESGPWHTRLEWGERVATDAAQHDLALHGIPDYSWVPQTYEVNPGKLTFTYGGGDGSERYARVVDEPGQDNRVLKFWLKQANVRSNSGHRTKGRVQMNAGNLKAREVRFSVRMYLHPDMADLRKMSKQMHWLTLSEWWNNADWVNKGHPFRVSLNLSKPTKQAGSALRFRASAQTLNKSNNKWNSPVWQAINQNIDVPFGQWVTLDYYFREGNRGEGRFYVSIKPDGGPARILFNVRDWTHHPGDASPDGLTHAHPVKLYAQKKAIDHVRNRGGTMQIYWDDLSFKLCTWRKPLADSACSPNALK